MADKKFLDEDGVSQFAEETKKYVDKHIANADIHVTADDKANWNGKQDALTAEQLAAVNSGISATDKGNYDAHIANADIHVTADDKAKIADVVNKANDADVVHKSGNETVNGTKTFTVGPVSSNGATTNGFFIKNTAIARNDVPTTIYHSTFRVNDKNNQILGEYCVEKSNSGSSLLNMNVRTDDSDGNQVVESLYLNLANDGGTVNFHPGRNNRISLGTSSLKWKDVNTVLLNGKDPAYADDLSNYLPLSGGAMTGSVISRNTDDNVLQLRGGATYTTGSYLTLCGKDYSSSGVFTITAQDGTNACILRGIPSGSLTWGGKQVVTEPNSIPFHNAYPRCKYLGTSITDDQNTAIKNRTYDDLFIGDYWTINGVNWRIAAIDYYYNVGDVNFDKGNIIVMPDTVLYNAQMNETDTTTGGYAGSLMRTQNLNSARIIAQNAFGSHLANHRVMLTSNTDDSGPSSWTWYDSDGVELSNEVQIFGTRVWGSALKGFDVATQKQQFPLMAFAPQFVNIRQIYWLHDISSRSILSHFSVVTADCIAGANDAINSHGVRPAVTLTYI